MRAVDAALAREAKDVPGSFACAASADAILPPTQARPHFAARRRALAAAAAPSAAAAPALSAAAAAPAPCARRRPPPSRGHARRARQRRRPTPPVLGRRRRQRRAQRVEVLHLEHASAVAVRREEFDEFAAAAALEPTDVEGHVAVAADDELAGPRSRARNPRHECLGLAEGRRECDHLHIGGEVHQRLLHRAALDVVDVNLVGDDATVLEVDIGKRVARRRHAGGGGGFGGGGGVARLDAGDLDDLVAQDLGGADDELALRARRRSDLDVAGEQRDRRRQVALRKPPLELGILLVRERLDW